MPSFSWTIAPINVSYSVDETVSDSVDLAHRDLRIGADGDLDPVNGDVVFTTGIEAIAQGLLARLQLDAGEYLPNANEGIDYLGKEVLGKRSTKDVRTVLMEEARKEPGVTGFTSFDVSFEPTTRTVVIDFEAETDLGLIIASSEV